MKAVRAREGLRAEDCPYCGPWVIARGIGIGQFCWHPRNLDERGRPHLQSLDCGEWDECPRLCDELEQFQSAKRVDEASLSVPPLSAPA